MDRAALDALVDTYEHKVGPRNGARVVARAWVDAAFSSSSCSTTARRRSRVGYHGEQGAHNSG